jgi:hypothetical protein
VDDTAVTERSSREGLEPLTPELALVDPELALLARKHLADPSESISLQRASTPPQVADSRAAARAARDWAERVETSGGLANSCDVAPRVAGDVSFGPKTERRVDEEASGRPRGSKRAILAAVALLLGVVGFVALAPALTNRSKRAVTVPNKRAEPNGVSRNSSAKAREPVTRPIQKRKSLGRRPTKRSSPERSSHKRSSPVGGPSSGRPQAPKQPRPTPPKIGSTRVFIWPAVGHASFYKVEFFRGGKKIFVRWPSTPRLELPLRWVYNGRTMRLVPGVYSWRVLPVFGTRSHPRLGNPIVRSTWRANG